MAKIVLTECYRCHRKILVDLPSAGADETIATRAIHWECLTDAEQEKAEEIYEEITVTYCLVCPVCKATLHRNLLLNQAYDKQQPTDWNHSKLRHHRAGTLVVMSEGEAKRQGYIKE